MGAGGGASRVMMAAAAAQAAQGCQRADCIVVACVAVDVSVGQKLWAKRAPPWTLAQDLHAALGWNLIHSRQCHTAP